MDIVELANRFVSIKSEYLPKAMSSIEKEAEKMTKEDRAVAKAIRIMSHMLENVASRPTESDKKKLKNSGIKIVEMKHDGWESCVKDYEVVSDFLGEEPNQYSNGLILKKGDETFYACCLDPRDIPNDAEDSKDMVTKFIEAFSRTNEITKKVASIGGTLPIVETFVCFHMGGYMGYVIYKGSPNIKTWHAYISDGISGNVYTKKNRKLAAEKGKKLAPLAKKKFELLHKNDIIFSFHGFGWLDSSSVIVKLDDKGTPIDIFPLNYSSSVKSSKATKDAKQNDFTMLKRLERNHNEESEKNKAIINVAAMKLRQEKFFV